MARYINEDEIAKSLYDYQWIDQDTYLDITKKIMEVPTADVQPVIHGEWLGTEYDGYSDGFPVYTTWKCSNCGAEFECEDMDFYYCPNCGAKMDLEEIKDGSN